jgi:hypothetical protein
MFAKQRSFFSALMAAALTFALSFSGIILGGTPATAGTMTNQAYIGWIGGSGGNYAGNIDCAAGSVMTGIRSATSGNSVFLGIECREILSTGDLGAVTRTSGAGGVFHQCPTGTAVVGLFVKTSNSPQNVGVHCQTPPNKLDDVQDVGPASGSIVKDVNCAANGFVNRTYLHSGAWFDGFMVGCSLLDGYPSAVVAGATGVPTGTTSPSAVLTNATTFRGLPTPTLSYIWERSSSQTGPWDVVVGATNSTYTLQLSDLGYYFRTVVTGSNVVNSLSTSATSTSGATAIVQLATPGQPNLQTASDTGTASADNETSDSTPTFDLTGLTAGAALTVTATRSTPTALTSTCTLTESQVTSSSASCTLPTLADGNWSVTAAQNSSTFQSSASAVLNLKVDTSAPTVSSIAITPDLAVDKKVRVTLTFSESIDVVDTTKILLGSTGTWTKSNPTISGATYSFDVVYTTLINDDITVAVGVGAVTDVAGNLQTAARTFFEQVNTVNSTASYAVAPVRLGLASTSTTMTLNFTRPVWGLTTSDFTWPANGASCNLSSVTPSSGPASTYTLAATCSVAGTSTLRLAANAVKDFAAVAGPAAALDLSVIRDTTAPTISGISSNVVGTRVDYTVTFSEELLQFPVSAISTAGATTASGTGTWAATTPARVGATNQWTFSVSNADAINGVYKPSFTVGGSIKDLSGNSLTVDPTITNATIVRLPTFVIGSLATPNSAAIALAPNFDLSLYSGKMHGIKITNLDWATSGTTKDAFITSAITSGNMGGSLTVNTSNGSLEILAPNATEAQWDTAIRAIQFDAGSNSGTRRFEFHLRPISGYIYSNEHYLILSSAASILPAAISSSSSATYAGLQGYLATITSAEEDAWSMSTSRAAWISGSDVDVEGTWVHTAGPELGQTLSPTYWDNPPQQPDLAAEDCLVAYATGGYSGWHDVMCSLSNYFITEYGGMPGDPSVPSMKATASTTIDAVGPDVTSVRSTTANGTYVVGESISIQVNLDEATIVAGGTPRIKLNTSPTVRYANYVSGSGASTLTFNYTIQAGDTAADLNYFDVNSLDLNGATLKDAAGNNATITLDATNAASSLAAASAIVIDADLFIAPTFSLGVLPGIGPNPTAIAPNFNLTTRGSQPFGILITNNSFDGAASVLDAFVLNPVPAGVTVVANGSGEIELYGSTLTEAQWEAAIRAIQFDAGSSGAAPNLTFHLRPVKAYDYETGHAYKQVAASLFTTADALVAAPTHTLAGFTGYLATPTTALETGVLVDSGMTRSGTQMMVALQKQASGSTLVKPWLLPVKSETLPIQTGVPANLTSTATCSFTFMGMVPGTTSTATQEFPGVTSLSSVAPQREPTSFQR